MKKKYYTIFFFVVMVVSFFGFKYINKTEDTTIYKIPSIEGTYKFEYRKLPDGTTVKPPNVMGIQTFTHGIRNFNIMWTDKKGKHFSFSVYSNYKFTDSTYTETIHFGVMNDEISGKGLTYITNQTKTVPIKYDGKKLEFKFPFDPPATTFEGNKMIAAAKGMFTDYWEKIK